MADALISCPFCGRASLTAFENQILQGMDTVICESCGARGPHVGTVEEAAAAWNARAPGAFQSRVAPWMQECFGPVISTDCVERGDRLLEETLELLQSGGYDRARVAQLVEYVWGRPAGEPAQEVGGVMVTLAAYCLAHDLDMHEAAATELARIWTKVPQIREKQATKATAIGNSSPLPIAGAPPARPSDDDLDPHLPESIRAEKRCGIQRSAWLTGWFVPWSPRNDNENAEGPWSHWVALAHAILKADATAIAKLAAAGQAAIEEDSSNG